MYVEIQVGGARWTPLSCTLYLHTVEGEKKENFNYLKLIVVINHFVKFIEIQLIYREEKRFVHSKLALFPLLYKTSSFSIWYLKNYSLKNSDIT